MNNVDKYIGELDSDRKEVIEKLRNLILANIDPRFEETFNYGMINYVVPLSIYPKGYLGREEGLPFLAISSMKNYVSFYHLGMYADTELLNWFKGEYNKLNIGKLDMGKSCIRFKKIEIIPYDLLSELVKKTKVEDVIKLYDER